MEIQFFYQVLNAREAEETAFYLFMGQLDS